MGMRRLVAGLSSQLGALAVATPQQPPQQPAAPAALLSQLAAALPRDASGAPPSSQVRGTCGHAVGVQLQVLGCILLSALTSHIAHRAAALQTARKHQVHSPCCIVLLDIEL